MFTFILDFTNPLVVCSVSWGKYSVIMPYHLLSSLMLDLECLFSRAVCMRDDHKKIVYKIEVIS